MNWFSLNRRAPLAAPNDRDMRPERWTTTNTVPTPTKTRPTTISRLFDEVAALLDDADKVELLSRNRHIAIKNLFYYTLSPIQWLVSPCDYEPCKFREADGHLYEVGQRVLHHFVDDAANPSPIGNNHDKRQKLFDNTLSSLNVSEGQVLIQACFKRLPKGISRSVVYAVYPELVEGEDPAETSRRNARKQAQAQLTQAIAAREKTIHQTNDAEAQAARTVLKVREDNLARANADVELAKRRLGELS